MSQSEVIRAWAESIRMHHKPRIDDEIARVRTMADDLRSRLIALRSQFVEPDEVQRLQADNATATTANERLRLRVEEARAVRSKHLIAAARQSLDATAELLREHEITAAREFLASADQFLGPAPDTVRYSTKSCAELDLELPSDPRMPQFRADLTRRACAAQSLLAAHAADLAEADRLDAGHRELTREIDRLSATLRAPSGHGVDPEVIRGVLALATDSGFASYCRTRAADTRLEAGWRDAILVLRPFRDLGDARSHCPAPVSPASVGRPQPPAAAPTPTRILPEPVPPRFDWENARREYQHLCASTNATDAIDLTGLARLCAAGADLLERTHGLAVSAKTGPAGHDLLAVEARLRDHLRIGLLKIEREGPMDPRLAAVLAEFEGRCAGPTVLDEFEVALERLTTDAHAARERADSLHRDIEQRRRELDALSAFADLLDALLTRAAGPELEPIP